eukprot:scaffold53821_cov50-Attheya_sp.AAC.3
MDERRESAFSVNNDNSGASGAGSSPAGTPPSMTRAAAVQTSQRTSKITTSNHLQKQMPSRHRFHRKHYLGATPRRRVPSTSE